MSGYPYSSNAYPNNASMYLSPHQLIYPQLPQNDFVNQRLQQLQQPQPMAVPTSQQQYNQAYQYNQPRQHMYSVRPVTNVEEVKALPIDYGTLNVFPNFAASEIYVSRINNDGLKDIWTFILKPMETTPPEDTRPTAQNVDLTGVYAKLDEIMHMIGGINYGNEPTDAIGNASNAKRGKAGAIPTSASTEQSIISANL